MALQRRWIQMRAVAWLGLGLSACDHSASTQIAALQQALDADLVKKQAFAKQLIPLRAGAPAVTAQLAELDQPMTRSVVADRLPGGLPASVELVLEQTIQAPVPSAAPPRAVERQRLTLREDAPAASGLQLLESLAKAPHTALQLVQFTVQAQGWAAVLAAPPLTVPPPAKEEPSPVDLPVPTCRFYERCEQALAQLAHTRSEIVYLHMALGAGLELLHQKQRLEAEQQVLGAFQADLAQDAARLQRLFGGPAPLFTRGAYVSQGRTGRLDATLGPDHLPAEVQAALGADRHVLATEGTGTLQVQFESVPKAQP